MRSPWCWIYRKHFDIVIMTANLVSVDFGNGSMNRADLPLPISYY